MSDALVLAKDRLRRRSRARRRVLAADPTGHGARAAALFPLSLVTDRTLAALRAGPLVVAGYRARGTEIDAAPLMRRLADAGAVIVLPAVIGENAPLVFREAGPWDGHVVDAGGVLSPPLSAAPRRPDVVIVPLLAFDRRGGRLGQGGGHYDRTLAALRAAGPLLAVGLAYAGQEVPALEQGPHDERLDAILTERAYIGL